MTDTFDGPVPGIPGAVIREVSALPEHLPDGKVTGPWTEVNSSSLLLAIPTIARFLIRDGTEIEVEPALGANRDAVAVCLLGSARGALIHQRGELALMAATLVAPNWACVAICGPSAFGKSTLAAELCSRGWQLLADDVTRVSWNGGRAVAWPSQSSLSLWRDACETLGLGFSDSQRVRHGLEKFHVPVTAATTPATLSHVVRLRTVPVTNVLRVPLAQRRDVLMECTFKKRLADSLGVQTRHARIAEQVAGTIQAIVLDGARERPVSELADRLAESVK
jgi:ABC-type uncharacterized transport system YnjBCD ATPase subunit